MIIFQQNSKYPLGLDISDYSLKLIQLNKKGKDSYFVQALSREELAKGVIEGGEVLKKDKLIETLKELVSRPEVGKISSKDVVASLPETKTYLKLIEVENGPNNIDHIIEAEMEKHIPFPIDEIYYDWQTIETKRSSQRILIGACPKKTVDTYIEIIREAKLSVIALEIEAVAMSRSLLIEESPKKTKVTSNKNYLIIDIGKKRTSIFVYAKKTPLFTLGIPLSGEVTTAQIAKSLEIDEKQAEKAKIVCGMDKTKAKGIIKNILSETIDNVIEKIEEALDYYKNHFPKEGEIDEITICGGGSNIKDIEKYIEDYMNIKTTKGNPLFNLGGQEKDIEKFFQESYKIKNDFSDGKNDSKALTVTQDNRLTYATAIGLALRNIFNKKF